MGLIYDPQEVATLKTAWDKNVKSAEGMLKNIKEALSEITKCLDNSESKATRKAKLIVENLTKATSNSIARKLKHFKEEYNKLNHAIERLPKEYLDEDNINKQIEEYERLRHEYLNSENILSRYLSLDNLNEEIHNEMMLQKRNVHQQIELIEQKITKLREKITKLHAFANTTNSYFNDNLADFAAFGNEIAFFDVISINTKDGEVRFFGNITIADIKNRNIAKIEKSVKMYVEDKKGENSKVVGASRSKLIAAELKGTISELKNGSLQIVKGKNKIDTIVKTTKKFNNIVQDVKEVKEARIAQQALTGTGKIRSLVQSPVKAFGKLGAAGALLEAGGTYLSREHKYGQVAAVEDAVAHGSASAAGTLAGAALGSMIPIPVVGTIVGAAVGGWFGSLIGNVYDGIVKRHD